MITLDSRLDDENIIVNHAYSNYDDKKKIRLTHADSKISVSVKADEREESVIVTELTDALIPRIATWREENAD